MLSHLAVSGAASRGALLECIQHLGTRATLSKQIDAERLLNMNLVHDVKSGSWEEQLSLPEACWIQLDLVDSLV